MAQQYHKTPGYSGYHLFRVAKEQGTNELWYSSKSRLFARK